MVGAEPVSEFRRIGEARAPGPGATVDIMCGNVTSLHARWASYEAEGPAEMDFALLQEVRLGKEGQQEMNRRLRDMRRCAAWSLPQPAQRRKLRPGQRKKDVTMWLVKQGGVGIFAHDPNKLIVDNETDCLRTELEQTRRWVGAAAPIGGGTSYLHLRSVYGDASSGVNAAACEANEAFITAKDRHCDALADALATGATDTIGESEERTRRMQVRKKEVMLLQRMYVAVVKARKVHDKEWAERAEEEENEGEGARRSDEGEEEGLAIRPGRPDDNGPIKIDDELQQEVERLFPRYNWQDGPAEGVALGVTLRPLPPRTAGCRWNMPMKMYEPIQWYFSNLRWPENDNNTGVTWLELARDFELATACEVDKGLGPLTTQQKAALFSAAVRSAAKISGGKWWRGRLQHPVPCLAPLGSRKLSGLSARPVLFNPRAVALSLAGECMRHPGNEETGKMWKWAPAPVRELRTWRKMPDTRGVLLQALMAGAARPPRPEPPPMVVVLED